ncbi:uncharacterized protein LOC121428159 [Lytechinus variegatus]|uniref:uncharacterized protein LOC121428159 n=1 Tax=Lytechinus variegatus TaxID=7654 RepID=UPI001BB299F5|nr:uncharacterized protein LOC121428159 [Lytechinus variegatus]
MGGPEGSNDTEKQNGNDTASQTPTKPNPVSMVKVKIEVDDDDDDHERGVRVDVENSRQKDLKAMLTSDEKTRSIPKRETDDAVGNVGRVSTRRNSDNAAGDNGMISAGAIENEENGSDDLNHDRYSPFDGMCENSESDFFSPIQDQSGNVILEVACGSNNALLYVNKLCQGSKGQCIFFEERWYTPNEFQFISGRETAKDWKRSIRHRGKSLKILMGRGLLMAHPLMCECDTCRLNFASKGLRSGDRRGAMTTSSSSSNGSSSMVDRSRLRRVTGPDGEGGHLNEIIDQLQHSNNNGYSNGSHNHAYDSGRKRSHGVDNPSPTGSSPSSMPCGLALVKRPRSVSPRDDDIYDEQQRKIFEAANSPEPQNIENLRRSLNLSSSRSNSPSNSDHHQSPGTGSHPAFYGSHGNGRNAPTVMVAASINNSNTTLLTNGSGPADLSRHSSASPQSATSTRLLLSQPPQMIVKHQTKSRKQTAPQHLDVGNHGDEAHPHRAAHIVLSSYSGQSYKANAAVRPRYQSTPVYNHRVTTNSSSTHHATGSSGELNLSTNGGSRRTQSSNMAAVTRSPSSQRTLGAQMKMIELTRPEIVPSSSSGFSSRPSSTHSSSNPGEEGRSHTPVHPQIGNADAVFLPADITSWSISDVSHFVQSLKGCEDYCQVFREQAIDGEILPVLTEDHLLHNMGLKLGPALKIRLHVARRLGFTLDGQYCNTSVPPQSTPLTPQLPPPTLTPQESAATPVPPRSVTPATGTSKPSSSEVFTDDV